MVGYYIGTLQDAERLVKVCSQFTEDIDIIYQSQIVDAKSFLGVASLLGYWVALNIITDNENTKAIFKSKIMNN